MRNSPVRDHLLFQVSMATNTSREQDTACLYSSAIILSAPSLAFGSSTHKKLKRRKDKG